MEKLTLEHIAPFLSYGVIFRYKDNGDNITQLATIYNIDVLMIVGKPILRPMNLTQPITVDGKDIIPIVELAKIRFPCDKWEVKYVERYKEYRCLSHRFDFSYSNVCGFNATYLSNMNTSCQPGNQLALFKWVYAHLFDVDGLIEKGLAIDVNTLETNPYEAI